MLEFLSVTPVENYILKIITSNQKIFVFDVMSEIEKISSYKKLLDIDFFNQVKFTKYRIYWDYDHDFHIDQVLHYATEIISK